MPSYTFLQIQTRVSEEINDATNANVSLTQVKKAIVSAIEHYERQRTWFNETIERNYATVIGAHAVTVPTDLVFLDRVQLAAVTTIMATTTSGSSALTACSSTAFTAGMPISGTGIPNNSIIKSIDSSTQMTIGDTQGTAVNATASATVTVTVVNQPRRALKEISWDEYSSLLNTVQSNGEPTNYCYHQDKIWLYRPPNAVFNLTLWYVKRLTTLSADGDNNGWTNYAEPVIRNRAKWDIYENLMRNPKLADRAKAQEMDAFAELELEREQRNTTRRLKPKYL